MGFVDPSASAGLPLSLLLDESGLATRLEQAGLPPGAARSKAELLHKCSTHLVSRADRKVSAHAFFVPGRIEVLGKHTDYCGGMSLLTTTVRGFVFVSIDLEQPVVDFHDAQQHETVSFELSPRLRPRTGHWANYPMTVARRLARNFPPARRGARIAFASDLPPAAGMSSSSALIVGAYLVLAEANEVSSREEFRREISDLESLASYLACIENGADFGSLAGDSGVGTQGGSEDHTAILCSHPGALGLYSFCPVRLEQRVAVPANLLFAVAFSGVSAEKTGGARDRYNRASRLAGAVAEAWRRATGGEETHLAAILARSRQSGGKLRDILHGTRHPDFRPDELLSRLEHFEEESTRIIPAAVDSLESRDLRAFGDWVDRSQEAGVRLLGNQVPETIALARDARSLGALASSAFGAGFGGSVWALVAEQESGAFLADWQARYRERFPERVERARFFLTAASPAALAIG